MATKCGNGGGGLTGLGIAVVDLAIADLVGESWLIRHGDSQ